MDDSCFLWITERVLPCYKWSRVSGIDTYCAATVIMCFVGGYRSWKDLYRLAYYCGVGKAPIGIGEVEQVYYDELGQQWKTCQNVCRRTIFIIKFTVVFNIYP